MCNITTYLCVIVTSSLLCVTSGSPLNYQNVKRYSSKCQQAACQDQYTPFCVAVKFLLPSLAYTVRHIVMANRCELNNFICEHDAESVDMPMEKCESESHRNHISRSIYKPQRVKRSASDSSLKGQTTEDAISSIKDHKSDLRKDTSTTVLPKSTDAPNNSTKTINNTTKYTVVDITRIANVTEIPSNTVAYFKAAENETWAMKKSNDKTETPYRVAKDLTSNITEASNTTGQLKTKEEILKALNDKTNASDNVHKINITSNITTSGNPEHLSETANAQNLKTRPNETEIVYADKVVVKSKHGTKVVPISRWGCDCDDEVDEVKKKECELDNLEEKEGKKKKEEKKVSKPTSKNPTKVPTKTTKGPVGSKTTKVSTKAVTVKGPKKLFSDKPVPTFNASNLFGNKQMMAVVELSFGYMQNPKPKPTPPPGIPFFVLGNPIIANPMSNSPNFDAMFGEFKKKSTTGKPKTSTVDLKKKKIETTTSKQKKKEVETFFESKMEKDKIKKPIPYTESKQVPGIFDVEQSFADFKNKKKTSKIPSSTKKTTTKKHLKEFQDDADEEDLTRVNSEITDE